MPVHSPEVAPNVGSCPTIDPNAEALNAQDEKLSKKEARLANAAKEGFPASGSSGLAKAFQRRPVSWDMDHGPCQRYSDLHLAFPPLPRPMPSTPH